MRTLKNSTLKKISLYFLALSFCMMALSSCSKGGGSSDTPDDNDNPATPPSSAKALTYFSFMKTANSGLSENCNSHTIGDTYYVTVPLGVSLKSLKPSFNVSAKATLSVGGKPVTNGVTAIDFSDVVEVVVTAEDKSTTKYYVLVKNGIPAMDKMVYEFMAKYSIPGISVSIGHKEKVIYSEGFGYADKDKREVLRRNYMLRLASCSKPMTSICIMRLVSEGKISLTDTPFADGGILHTQFPESNSGYEDITIRSLLEHTSGITNQGYDPMFSSNTSHLSNVETIRKIIKEFALSSEVGTTHSYSNFGFCVLGRIIEAASGKTYEAYLKETIADMIERQTPKIGSTKKSERYPNETYYYSQNSSTGYGNNMKRVDSCGGLVATTPDLMRLAFSLDGLNGIPDIMSRETYNTMTKASAARRLYALGWRVNHSFFPGAAYHTGNLAGTATMWVTNYNQATHCAILCNSRSYISGFDDALYVLMRNILKYDNWDSYKEVSVN